MSVKKVAAGKWVATVWDKRAKREIQKTLPTKAKATAWEQRTYEEIRTGDFVDERDGSILVRDWVWTWLATKGHLAPKTYSRVAGIAQNDIATKWGNRTLNSLTFSELQEWFGSMPGAPATVKKIHGILSQMLDLAVRDQRLKRNEARGIQLRPVVAPKHRYLTDAQVDDLINVLTDERDKLIVLVLAYCGLRWGELAALKVGSFLPIQRRLSVDDAVVETDGYQTWGLPKDYQRRQVSLMPFIAMRLGEYCRGRGLEEPLFPPGRGGAAIRVGGWTRDVLKPAVVAAGLPKGFHPHEFRHTAASLAVASGADPKGVQAMLGHARASMTLDVYSDLFPDQLDDVAEAMDRARTQALENRQADFIVPMDREKRQGSGS